MVDHFVKKTKRTGSGFYLYNHEELSRDLKRFRAQKAKKVLLLGVSFALLDFAEAFPSDFSNITIMETGGMKGRRKELSRVALHDALKSAFNVSEIHSEYGMTELLSQCYSRGHGLFQESSFQKVLIHQLTDPLTIENNGKTGSISMIDLGNIDSCSFLRTEDLGRKKSNTTFEILGRIDNSEIRGCNLMVSDI